MVKSQTDQRASSCNSDSTYLSGVGVTHSLEVKRLTPDDCLKGLRVLFTRVANGVIRKFSPEEWLFISEATHRLSLVKDRNFLEVHWVRLEMLKHCYTLSRISLKRKLPLDSREFHDALTAKNDPSIKEKLFAFIPLHEYFGNYAEWTVKSFIKKINLLTKKSHPPQRFVGVGYRDKGSRLIDSTDGRPAWQEVASSPTIYDRGRILDPGSFEIKAIRVGTFNPFK